ncbi:MAG: 50S ribosomal protein L17 [Prevotella sp.]|nr:50S ribosomal protein L17 [Prevotella sp.]
MRHNKKFNHLGRTTAHRHALLANMAISLIRHKRINTTVAKAKALRKYVEPLLTRSKDDTTHSRRVVFSYLQNKEAVTELFQNISAKIGDRPGGYTRIIKTGFRRGDAADMCFIELVDYDDNMAKTAKTAKKTRRSRRKTSDNAGAQAPAGEKTEEKAEAVEAVAEPVAEEAEKAEETPKTE